MPSQVSLFSSRNHQILLSSLSCFYSTVVIFFLIYYKGLHSIGKYTSLPLIGTCIFVECFKVSLSSFLHVDKSNKPKKHSWKNKLKCVAVMLSMIVIYYVTAIFFGAAVLSNQEETLMFSILLTALTVVPTCLQLGADTTTTVLMEVTTQDNNHEDIKQSIIITWLGAWLGAIAIPLDWDRPWQVWPIPCCLGALIGYTAAHIFQLLKCIPTFSKFFNRKVDKYEL